MYSSLPVLIILFSFYTLTTEVGENKISDVTSLHFNALETNYADSLVISRLRHIQKNISMRHLVFEKVRMMKKSKIGKSLKRFKRNKTKSKSKMQAKKSKMLQKNKYKMQQKNKKTNCKKQPLNPKCLGKRIKSLEKTSKKIKNSLTTAEKSLKTFKNTFRSE